MAALVSLVTTAGAIYMWENRKKSTGVDETHLDEEKLALSKSKSTRNHPHGKHRKSWKSRLHNTVNKLHVDAAPKTNPANDTTPAPLPSTDVPDKRGGLIKA